MTLNRLKFPWLHWYNFHFGYVFQLRLETFHLELTVKRFLRVTLANLKYIVFFSFQHVAHYLQLEQLTNENFLWLSSLVSPDPFYVIPALYCISAGTILKVNILN